MHQAQGTADGWLGLRGAPYQRPTSYLLQPWSAHSPHQLQAGAAEKGVPLYKHIADLAGNTKLILPVRPAASPASRAVNAPACEGRLREWAARTLRPALPLAGQPLVNPAHALISSMLRFFPRSNPAGALLQHHQRRCARRQRPGLPGVPSRGRCAQLVCQLPASLRCARLRQVLLRAVAASCAAARSCAPLCAPLPATHHLSIT